MSAFFSKTWWSGASREDPGDDLGADWAAPPKYRPGWTIKYRHRGKTHIGRIRYVFREAPNRLDFYAVVRTKNNAEEIAFECNILGKVEA